MIEETLQGDKTSSLEEVESLPHCGLRNNLLVARFTSWVPSILPRSWQASLVGLIHGVF